MLGDSFQIQVTDAAENSLLLATVFGFASIPCTLILSWEYSTLINGAPMIVTGLLVGYLYATRPTASYRAGFVAGLVASLGGVIVVVTEIMVGVSLGESSRVELLAVPPLFVLLVICLAVSVMTCAIVGQWIRIVTARFRAAQPAE